MQEQISKIISGFDEVNRKINNLRKYINIFNEYDIKLKMEFERTGKYISNDEYNDNLQKINSMDIEEIVNIINCQIEKFRTLEDINMISEQYITFIINELTNYNWNSMVYINEYTIKKLENFKIRLLEGSEKIYTKEDNEAIRDLYHMIKEYCFNYAKIIFDKITSIEIFKKVSNIKNNIVMIGANGSGKSTFARTLKGKIDNNITIIPAQHLLTVSTFDIISIKENMIEKVNKYQQENKLGSDENLLNLLSHDFEDLIKALLLQKGKVALMYYDNNKREESILNKVINMWNELLEHRKIINPDTYILEAETSDGQTYNFNLLSDGEKAIFYYIAHVLLAKEKSYIIVDEPENHINLSICNRLWNKLEVERNDCKFIYLTHNIDFAISRNNTTLIWNQEFIPPASWNFEIIQNNFNLPDKLLMELLGSRNNILFCEGDDKNSYDYKLYTILFPKYNVIPVGGHLNVINYCNAYNSKNQLLKNKAVGIIDGDCHEVKQIIKWKTKGIYTLNINEIENLLCDNLILEKAKCRFMISDEQIIKFKDIILKRLNANKQKQATWYVKNKINNRIKNNFLNEEDDIEKLKEELNIICQQETIDKMYNDRLQEIEDIFNKSDYEGAIKIIDAKENILELANKELEQSYKDKIVTLIMEDFELQKSIKEKYFCDIEE